MTIAAGATLRAALRRRAEITPTVPRPIGRSASLRPARKLIAAGEPTRALMLLTPFAAGTVIVFIIALGLASGAAIETADDDVFFFHVRAAAWAAGAGLAVGATRPCAEPHHAWRLIFLAVTLGIGRATGLAIGPGIRPVASLGLGALSLAALRRRAIAAIIIAHVGPAVAFAPGFGRGRIIVFNNDHAPFDHFTSGRAIGAAVLREGRHRHVPEREK